MDIKARFPLDLEVMNIENIIGEERLNTYGTLMRIVSARKKDDIDVQFLDEHGYIKEHCIYENFKRGQIKNPYDKSKYGVGYIGVGKHKAKVNCKYNYIYDAWADMLNRCYHSKNRFPAYYGIFEVCSEWHNFQVFGDWYEENEYQVDGRLHLDKDILYPGCRIYSPKTCILVPQRINLLFSNKPNNRGLPNGIYKIKNGYMAKYQGNKIGNYSTLEEAYAAYAMIKEKTIKSVADEYVNIIPKKVYEALYAYKVDINYDKNYKAS